MTISLCPVLMNFSMQITHLNQKWSPVLFVFRQLMRQENPKKKKKTACLLLPFVSSDSFVLLCIFCYCKPSTPCFSLCVCGPVDGRAQLSRPNNWRNSLRYLEFKMTSAHCCVLHQKYSEQRKFLHVLEKRVTVRTNSRSWAECNDSASFFFCFFSCSTAHGVTGD